MMVQTNFNDICGRFLTSRLSKQPNGSFSKNSLKNEHIANDHKCHTILNQKLFFKPYKKNPLDQLRQRYSNVLLSSTTTNNELVNHQQSKPIAKKSSNPSSSSSSSSLMMNWELVKDRGSGLINLGNTCFINASLQCLANTPPLVQWLLSNSHHQHCRMKSEKQFCLLCEAERIVKLIHSKNSFSSSSTGPANPNNIARRIRDISKTFRFGRQEDASEFLICLLDKIVEACLRSSQPPERLRPSSGTSYEQLCHSQTFLHDLFALVLRSRVICSRCRSTSDTFEVQYTWIVSVRNQSDLRQSLQQFVCRENLSGENLYRCTKCKQLVPAVKRYTLHKASKILLINFKRFEFGKNSHKLSHLVRYPEYLNVKPYMSDEHSNDQSLNYRLYAVLVHVGSSMHSGHYYSYVRSPNNRWYKADDTAMTQCDLNQVLTQHGAYILCYIKESEPSSTSNGMMVHQNGKPQTISVPNNSKFFSTQQPQARTINGLSSQPSNIVKRSPSSISNHSIDFPNKSKSTPVLLTTTKTTNNHSLSNGSTLKFLLTPSVTNGYSSHTNGIVEPMKKKIRLDESPSLVPYSSSSSSPSSQTNSIDEQSVPSLTTKKKKKFHQQHLLNGIDHQISSPSIISNGQDSKMKKHHPQQIVSSNGYF